MCHSCQSGKHRRMYGSANARSIVVVVLLAVVIVRKAVDRIMHLAVVIVRLAVVIVRMAVVIMRKAVDRTKFAAIKHPRRGTKYRQTRTSSNKR